MNGPHPRRPMDDRHGGDFDGPPSDPRATQRSRLWDAAWAPSDPSGPDLRRDHPDRWVRFWSLPDGRRLPEGDADMAVILHRYRTVLEVVNPEQAALTVVGADWGPPDGAGGWTRQHLPGRRPWRISSLADDGGTPGTTFFWASEGVATDDLDDLLRLAAVDAAHVIVVPPDMSWVFAPYDGGVDVLVIDSDSRETVREPLGPWLSTHPEGL